MLNAKMDEQNLKANLVWDFFENDLESWENWKKGRGNKKGETESFTYKSHLFKIQLGQPVIKMNSCVVTFKKQVDTSNGDYRQKRVKLDLWPLHYWPSLSILIN